MCLHTFILDDVIMYVQVHTAYDIRPGFSLSQFSKFPTDEQAKAKKSYRNFETCKK